MCALSLDLLRSTVGFRHTGNCGLLPRCTLSMARILTRRKSRLVVAMRMNDLDMPEVVRQRLSSDSELEFASIFAGTCIADREWLLFRNSVLVTSVFTLAGLWASVYRRRSALSRFSVHCVPIA